MAGVLASNTWTNNNVSWVSSASSILDTTTESFKAFNGIHSSNDCWHDNQTGYTAAVGGSPANSTFQTPVFATGTSGTINTYNGQWLQIQASIPLVMKTFYFGGRGTQPARLPQLFYIVGSNTGTGSWTPIFKGTTTSTTGAVLSGTVSLSGLAPSAAGTISNFYGSTALTYDNTYGNTASSFTYFRLIVSRICSNETTCNIGEWGLTFDKVATTTTTNSSVSLALDNAVPNQLNVGGSLNINGLTLGGPGPIFVSGTNIIASPAPDGTGTMNLTTYFPGAVIPQGTLFLVRLSSINVTPSTAQINVSLQANVNNNGWFGIGSCQHFANADYTYFGDMVPFYNAGGQGPIQFGLFLRFFNTSPAAGAYPIGSLTISVFKIF
jgi:hypothetical protein